MHDLSVLRGLNAQIIALDRFRRDYGVRANPEDRPSAWQSYLRAAQDEINAEKGE